MKSVRFFLICVIILSGCNRNKYDVIIRNAKIYDGSGSASYVADLGIRSDTIAFIGDLKKSISATDINASELAVSPGFINMLSWANESLIEDGRCMSELKQGVTLEVLGEGSSMGPLNDKMKSELKESQGDIKYDVGWSTLGEYLAFLEKKGVSVNIASFVGATTLREYMIGSENRAPSDRELDSMKLLLDQAIREGAAGISSALQYVPACFASTEELIALCREAAKYDVLYISHVRDEGDRLLPSIDELIRTARESGIRAEVYHLKQSGKSSWRLLDEAVRKIDSARTAGLKITADMYNYTASWTGFDIIMPDWVQEGGYDAWAGRLRDPEVRMKIIPDIHKSILQKTGTAGGIMVVGFNNDSLKYLTGKSLEEIARIKKESPEEAAIDLVIQDGSRVSVIYFSMSEENVKRQVALPWMSFCSDAEADAPEGTFLKHGIHPRAYGNFVRLLGKYVREEKIISLEDAIHKLTYLPASNMKLKKRGMLRPGYYADVVIFDPATVGDKATYENPRQYASGIKHVFVNGVQVIRDGEHTGAMPGRIVRGPGWIRPFLHE